MLATSPILSAVSGKLGPLTLHGGGSRLHVRSRRAFTLTPTQRQLDAQDCFFIASDAWYLDPPVWALEWVPFVAAFRPALLRSGFKRPTGYTLFMSAVMQYLHNDLYPAIFPHPPAAFARQPHYTVTYASARASALGNLHVDLTLTKSPPLPANADHEIIYWYDSESYSRDVFSPPRRFDHAGQQYMDDSPTQNISWVAGPPGVWNTSGGDAFFFRLKLFSRYDLVSTIGTYRLITIHW